MAKLLELKAKLIRLAKRAFVLSCFFLAACGDGTDLSGLLSSSGTADEEDTSGLSTDYGLSASPALTSVSLSWNEDPLAVSYDLYRYQDSNCASIPDDYTECANASYRSLSVPSATDSGLSSNSIYYYRVRSVSAEQNGLLSDQLEVLTLPVAPSSLTATADNGRAIISWEEQSGIDQYQLYRYSDQDCESVITNITACADDEIWLISGGETSQQDTGATGGETYYYQIVAVNASGTSSLSPQLTFTAPPDSISGFGIVSSSAAIGGISLVWSDSAGASYYEIYRDSISGCEGIPDDLSLCPDAVRFVAEESEYLDASAQEGFSYYYSARAANSSGASILTTQRFAHMPLELSTPVLSSATAEGNAIDLNWSAVDKALSYEVYIATEPNCSDFPDSPEDCSGFVWLQPNSLSNITTATSVSFSNLVEGNTYYLSVRAVTGETFSDLSSELSVTTAPAAPDSASFQAVVTDSEVTLSWSPSVGADTYSLYWHSDSSCLDTAFTVEAITTNCSDHSVISDILGEIYIHSDLNASTHYHYYLLASNAAGASALTSPVSVLSFPSAVQDLASESDTSSITLSWSSDQPNLDHFEVYRYQEQGCLAASDFGCNQQSSWQNISPDSSTFTDTTAQVGETYYYQVATVNISAKTPSSEVASALRLNPTDQISVAASEGLLTVSWSAVAGVEHYVLYRYSGDCSSLPDSDGSCSNYQEQILDANVTTFIDSTVIAGESYSYQVAARITGAEDSELSAIASGSPLLSSLELALTPIGGGIRIEFGRVLGADSYHIYRYSEAGCLLSEASASISCLDYQLLELAADSDDLVHPDDSAQALYDDLGLVGGSTYYYRASSVNALDASELSPEASSIAHLAQPTIVTGVAGYGSSSVDWNGSLGAESYTIYQYIADGSECYPQSATASSLCTTGFAEHTIAADVDDNSAAHIYSQDFLGLDGALDYGYVALASNALVPDSELSEPLLLHIGLPAPESLAATPDASAVNLSWDAVANSVGYAVHRSSIPNCLSLDGNNSSCADYALLLSGLNLSLVDAGLEGGTTYYYRAAALEDSSTSGAYSAEVSATPILQTPQNVQALPGSGSVDLTWDPVLGAESYTIYRYTAQPCAQILDAGGDCGELYIDSNNSAHSHTSNLLIGDQTYYFRIAATHTGLADSNLSDEVSSTPEVGVPTLEVSVIENSLTASWSVVAGTSGYNLHRSTLVSCFTDVDPADYASSSSLCPDYQTWEGVTTTSVSESDLDLDKVYYYAVQSVVDGVVFANISNIVSALPLAQPQWLELIPADREITINWDTTSVGADSYTIYRSSIADCSEALADWQQCPEGRIFSEQSSGTLLDRDSLTPGQTYHYRLQAVNYSGYALNPTELNATTAPDIPADINVTFSEIGVSVEWDQNQLGVEQYDLYRYPIANCEFIPEAYEYCGDDSVRWLDATSPLLDPIEDLEPGTVYYYTLAVSNAAGSHKSSEQQIITGSEAPEIADIVGGYGSIEVSWASVFGADSYNLYRYAQADCSDTAIVELSPDCSVYQFEEVTSPFTDPPSADDPELQLDSSTYYYYRLTSTNSSASSELSALGTGLTKPAAPEIVLATGGDQSAYLEYTSQDINLNQYIFSRDTVSGCDLDLGVAICPQMVELAGDLDTNHTDTGLNPGTTYYYHAYAVNDSGRSLASNEVAITTIPSSPLNLAASADSTNTIMLTWDRQIGTDSYVIYRYTDPTCSTEQLEANISQCGSSENPSQLISDIADDTPAPEYIDSGLNPDVNYYYRIRAQNVGGISAFSEAVNGLTSPSAIQDLAGIGGDAEVNLSWSPVANVSSYNLYRYTDQGCPTYDYDIASCSDGQQWSIPPETSDIALYSYQDTAVSNSTYYYYRIQAVNTSGAGAISDELEVLTYPALPQSLTSDFSASEIHLTWSIENSVTAYDLYRYSNSACASLYEDYASCDNAMSYQIDDIASATGFQSQIDADLQVGTVYYYQLVSHNTSGSKATDEFAIATAPAAPEDLSVTPVLGLSPSLDLSWSADLTGVDDFTVYRYQPSGCLLDDGNTSACAEGFPITFNGIIGTSFTDETGLATGSEYSYRVSATSVHSSQAQSAFSVEQSATTFPASPAITSFVAEADSMAINFEANQTGAESYTLYRYSGLPGCVSILGVVNNCNDLAVYENQTQSPIIDTGLDSGALYYYRIAANGVAGTGIYSDEHTAITLPAQPTDIELVVSLDGIVASWDAEQQGADSFTLYRSRTENCLVIVSDGSLCEDYVVIDSLTSGEYNDSNLDYGYEYFYQLRAVNTSGVSALSPEFSAYTLPPAPDIDSIVGGAQEVEINYTKTATGGITTYNLYRYTNSGCVQVPGNLFSDCADGERWSSITAIDGTTETVIDDRLEDGTVYYYRLAAVNSSGEGPASMEYDSATVPGMPTITAVIGGDRRIEVEFTDDLATATSYIVYRYSAPGCYDDTTETGCQDNEWETFSVLSSPAVDAGLDAGSKFYYSVVAVNSSGSSAFSNQESGVTIPEESTILSVSGGDGLLEINFDDAITGAETYHVYGYTSSNCLQKLSDYDSKQLSCEAVIIESASSPAFEENLDDGTTRYYRIASVNDSGSSDLSGQDYGITLPPIAEAISFTGDGSSLTLSWDDNQNGVNFYSAYQYTNSNCANLELEEASILTACSDLHSQDNVDSPVTFTSLNPGTTYYHLIKSTNASGYKFTDELEATTVPAAPPAPTLSADANVIEINFDPSLVAGAEHFQIHRASDSACVSNDSPATCSSLITLPIESNQTLTAEDFPYTDSDLPSGTTYYYHLSAHNALGASPYSAESSITTAPDAPSAISLSPEHQSITISWANSSGITGTRVYRYTNSGCSGVPNAISSCSDAGYTDLNSSTTTYTDTGLAYGSVYYYTLEAYNANGAALSAEYSALTRPATTSITSITGGDLNVSIEFEDSLIGELDNYVVYRHHSSEADCLVQDSDYSLNSSACLGFETLPTILEPTLTESPYIDTNGLSPGQTYYYQIQSFNSSGGGVLSAVGSAITIPAAPLASSITTSSSLTATGASEINITWNNSILGNTLGSTLYRYTIPGCQAIYGAAPDASQCSASSDGYKVWDNLTDTSDAFTIEDSGLQSSTEYYYVIQVSNVSGSAYSEEIAVTTYPAIPADPIVTGGAQQITVEWDNTMPTVTSYTLHFHSDDSCSAYDDSSCTGYLSQSFSSSDANTSTLSTLSDGTRLPDGTTYYVTLVAENASGTRASNTVSAITLPAAPVFSALDYLSSAADDSFAAADSIELSWNPPTVGLDSYTLVRYEEPDCMSEEGDYSSCTSAKLYVEDGTILASATSFSDSTDLEPAIRYYYRLGANNASGTAWSDVGEQVAAPEVIDPTVITSSATITVGWDIPADQDIASVNVYSTSKLGCSAVPPATVAEQCTDWHEWSDIDPALTSSIDYSPADRGQAYYLYLHAFNASGSALSSAVTGVLLADAPEFTTISGGEQSIYLIWESISSAINYTLYFYDTSCSNPDSAPEACGTIAVSNPITNSATINTLNGSTLAIGTEYFFRVSVTNSSGTSALSAESSAYTIASVPTNIAATSGGKQISLQWDASVGATNNYNLYRYSSSCSASSGADLISSCSANLTSNATSPYTDTDLEPGETHFYRATAVNDSGESAPSAEVSAEVLLAAPVSLSAQPTNSGVELSWTTINGAQSHEIYRYTTASCMTTRSAIGDCSTYDTINHDASTTYLDAAATGGTTYYYRVAAIKDSLPAGELSNEASITAQLLAPEIYYAIGDYGAVELVWSSVDGAASYKIYRSTIDDCLTDTNLNCSSDQQFATLTTTGGTTTYTDTDLEGLQTYYYQMTAVATDTSVPDSLLSNQVSAKTELPAPENLSASPAELSISLSWNPVTSSAISSSDVSYAIYRYTNTDSSCTAPHETVSSLSCSELVSYTSSSASYTDSNFTSGGSDYKYRVQALHSNGSSTDQGDISSEVSAQPILGTPASPILERGSTSLTFSWAEVSGADEYFVHRHSDASCGTNTDSINSCSGYTSATTSDTSFAATSLDPSTTYYFTVQATRTGAVSSSAYADVQSALPYLADITGFKAYASAALEITAEWDPVDGADSYTVYLHQDADCTYSAYDQATDCTSVSITSYPTTSTFMVFDATSHSIAEGQSYYFQVQANQASPTNISDYTSRIEVRAFTTSGITTIVGDDQEINFTFNDTGSSDELTVYRYTDPNCTEQQLTSNVNDCALESGDANSWPYYPRSSAISEADRSINDSGLKEGKRYFYRIWSTPDAANQPGVFSEPSSAMTMPPVPTTLGLHQAGTSGGTYGTTISLTFALPDGEDNYYQLLRHTDADCFANLTYADFDRSDYRDLAAVTNTADEPCANLTSLPSDNPADFPATGSSTESYTDSGLTPSTTYYYLYRSVNYSGAQGVDPTYLTGVLSGTSVISNQVEWSTIPRVSADGDLTIAAAEGNSTSVPYSFSAIPTATSYTIHRYLSSCSDSDITTCPSHTEFIYAPTDIGTTLTFTGLEAGTKYSYILQAHNSAGSADLATSYVEAEIATLPSDPTLTAVTGGLSGDTTQLTISWSADTGVTHRSIYGSTDQSCLQGVIDGGLTNAETDIKDCANHIYLENINRDNDYPITAHADTSDLLTGTTYYFTIVNHNTTGASLAFAPIDSNITVPAAVNDISLAADYREIEVTWTPPLGSDSNVLYRYNASTCADPITNLAACGSDTAAHTFTTADSGFTPDSSTSFSFADTNLLDAEQYFYAVQSINISGHRLTADEHIESNTTAPAIPTNLGSVASDNSIILSWDPMPEADDYHILRSTNANCYTDSTGVAIYSSYSSCANYATFDIAHDSISDPQSFTDSSLEYATTYYYWIRSSSTSGYSPSTITAEVNTTAPPTATQVSLSATTTNATQTKIEIGWSAVAAATSYALYSSTFDNCIADSAGNLQASATSCADYTRAETSNLEYTHSSLPNNNIYYYYVAGINPGGEGRLSPVNSIRTTASAPSLSLYNQGAATEIEVTWNATSSYDTEYQLYIYSGSSSCDPSTTTCTNEKHETITATATATGADSYSHTFTGLNAGTKYYARIIVTTEYTQEDATSSTLTSPISDPKEMYTRPYHPSITSYSITNDNSNYFEFTLSDNGSGTDDVTYTIYRTESSSCTRTQATSSSCSNDAEITSTSSPIDDNHPKDDSTHYYYYAWSANPGGASIAPDGYDTSAFIATTNPDKISSASFSNRSDDSTTETIAITVHSGEPIPANDTWQLVYYPFDLTDPKKLTYTITNLDSSNEYSAELPVSQTSDALYLFQRHTINLETTNASGVVIKMYGYESAVLPPPVVRSIIEKSSNDDHTKVMQYDFDMTNSSSRIQAIRTTYGLELEMQYYVTKSISCFSTADMLATDTTCTYEQYFDDILASESTDYVYHTNDALNVSFNSSYNGFIHTQDFSTLANSVNAAYYYFAAVSGYKINGSNSAANTYTASFDDDSTPIYENKLVVGNVYDQFLVPTSSTNSIQAPSPSLVPTPALLSQQLAATSADHNSWDLTLLWSALSGVSAYDIYEYSNPDCPYLLSEPSLCAGFSLYSSNIPEFTRAFSAADSGQYFYYRLQAYDSSGNSGSLSEQLATYLPQSLNDSGLASCLESELISGSQDCQVGRDSEFSPAAKVGSGAAGFDFNSSLDDSGALCVHDNVTGLSWSSWSAPVAAIEADSSSASAPSTSSFAELASVTSAACGHSDWRLPSLHELLSIADYQQSPAKLDTSLFSEFNLSLPTYWSASGHIVDFSSGELSFESNASARHSVFLVRGQRGWGLDFGAERFQLVQKLDDNNLSLYLVYDNQTQLHYSPCLAGQSYDSLTHSCTGVATTLDYIDSLNAYDANSSWRQPNIKELVAILDPSHSLQPSPEFFPAYPAGAQIFTLTPEEQGADYITGRLFDSETQSTQPVIFELLNSHLIYRD